jgi:hypothetical protein
MARSRHRVHAAAVVIIGIMGVLGFGAWSQSAERADELLYVGMALAALLPALALLALLGDTARRGRLSLSAANLLALGAVIHLLLGDPAPPPQPPSSRSSSGHRVAGRQVHYSLYGAATLGAFAALWFWAPKIWGVMLGSCRARPASPSPSSVRLLLSAPTSSTASSRTSCSPTPSSTRGASASLLSALSLLGGLLGVLGVLLVVGELLGKVGAGRAHRRRTTRGADRRSSGPPRHPRRRRNFSTASRSWRRPPAPDGRASEVDA